MQALVVVGGGGFCREVLDVVESINGIEGTPTIEVLGVIDDHPSSSAVERLAERGYKHLGGLQEWIAGGVVARYIIAIGNPSARRRVCSLIGASTTLEPLTVVHPTAVVGSRTQLGEGSVVCAGVQISTNVRVGKHVHLNPGTIIGHDANLADCVSINPGAIVSGDVAIGDSCLVGAGAVVLQGLIVGAESIIGAGGVVTRDVPPGTVVKGVPAR